MLMLNARDFYRKWIQDIFDSQDLKSGHVNHTAPFAGRMVPRRLVHAAKGGSAGIICQHLLLYKGASDNGVRRSDFGRSR